MLFTRFALASGGQPLQRRPVVVVDFDFEVAEPADRRRRGVEKRALRACPLRIRLRAIIRDMFPPADAQRVMSQVTIFFGVAPAIEESEQPAVIAA
jgi:hypothetical protein